MVWLGAGGMATASSSLCNVHGRQHWAKSLAPPPRLQEAVRQCISTAQEGAHPLHTVSSVLLGLGSHLGFSASKL